MNSMTKLALVGASIFSLGALTACQSTDTVKENKQAQMMKDHHAKHERKLTPEQREQFHQARAERKQVFEQIKKACDSKAVGQVVHIKAGDKTVNGTCVMTFKADRKAMKQHKKHDHMKGEHRPMHGEIKGMHMQRSEPLTDAKRAELTQKFEQRLAKRQTKQQALLKACQGQTNGQAVQVKLAAQTIHGQCEVRFQPKVTPHPPSAVKAPL